MFELFAPNITVEVVHVDPDGNLDVVGYLFVTNVAETGAQEQRWVLRPGNGQLPYQGTISFRFPPAELSFTTLEGWQEAVMAEKRGGLWLPGSTYVKVESRSFAEMVHPLDDAPAYPTLVVGENINIKKMHKKHVSITSSVQIESRDWKIHQWSASDEWVRIGQVYGTKSIQDDNLTILRYNREYWVTLPGYQSPLSTKTASIRLQDSAEGSFDDFLRGASADWTSGSTFTIASCSYLDAVPANP